MSTSNNIENTYRSVIASIKQQRDELNVEMRLARMEVRGGWDEVEKKWQQAQSKAYQLDKASAESVHEHGQALSILSDELKETCKRLKTSRQALAFRDRR
jgi:hypothetical protein